MKSFFGRYVGAFCLTMLVLCLCGVARAQTPCAKVADNRAHVCWGAVTTNTDGSSITGAVTYTVQRQNGSSWVNEAAGLTATDWTSGVLQPGTYVYRVTATAGGQTSAPSNTGSKLVPVQVPSAPTPTVVAVVIGVDHSPVFTVLSSGGRSTTVAGMARVGTRCEGPVLFKYRDVEWRKPSRWKPWATDKGVRVAAPCA